MAGVCLLVSRVSMGLLPTGDNEDPASKKQRGRPKGSRNRRTEEAEDGQHAVSSLLFCLSSGLMQLLL